MEMGLNCHIQSCRWFIHNEDRRVTGQCHRYHNALSHPARKLVRVFPFSPD